VRGRVVIPHGSGKLVSGCAAAGFAREYLTGALAECSELDGGLLNSFESLVGNEIIRSPGWTGLAA